MRGHFWIATTLDRSTGQSSPFFFAISGRFPLSSLRDCRVTNPWFEGFLRVE